MPLCCPQLLYRLVLPLLAQLCHEQQEAGCLWLQAEDARILRNISQMRTTYSQLQDLNR